MYRNGPAWCVFGLRPVVSFFRARTHTVFIYTHAHGWTTQVFVCVDWYKKSEIVQPPSSNPLFSLKKTRYVCVLVQPKQRMEHCFINYSAAFTGDAGLRQQLMHALTPTNKPLVFIHPCKEEALPTPETICWHFGWKSYRKLKETITRELAIKPKTYDRLFIDPVKFERIVLTNNNNNDTFELCAETYYACHFQYNVIYIPAGYSAQLFLSKEDQELYGSWIEQFMYRLLRIEIIHYPLTHDQVRLNLDKLTQPYSFYMLHRDPEHRAYIEERVAALFPKTCETKTIKARVQLHDVHIVGTVQSRHPEPCMRAVQVFEDGSCEILYGPGICSTGLFGRIVWGETVRHDDLATRIATAPDTTATLISFKGEKKRKVEQSALAQSESHERPVEERDSDDVEQEDCATVKRIALEA